MPESKVAELERWADHGALWRVVHVSERRAIVDLCTCYGEPVERLESDERELIEYLRGRRGSADEA